MAASSHGELGLSMEREALSATLQNIISVPARGVSVAPTPIGSSSTDLLDQVRQAISVHERAKYPPSHYSQQVKSVDIGEVSHQVTQVTYDGKPLTDTELKTMESESIIVRKLNLMAGVLYAMQLSPHYLAPRTDQQKNFIEDNFEIMLQRIITPLPTELAPDKQIENFVSELTDLLSGVTRQSKEDVIRSIRNAEQYFVADNNKQRVLAFQTTINDQPYWSVDIPFGNKVTEKQKAELLLIYQSGNKPSWYKALSPWEKDWMKSVVPRSLASDWNQFERLFQSSAMQHIPGIKNSRTNYLVKASEENVEIISRHINLATMVPYEMPDDSRDRNALLTAEQMLKRLEKQAFDNFNNLKHIFPDLPGGFKPIVLAQSILSDVALGGSDNLLMETQKASITQLSKKDEHSYFQIISGNDPVNFLRMTTTQSEDRWAYAIEAMKSAEHLLIHLDPDKQIHFSDAAKTRFDLIKHAHDNLQELTGVGSMSRLAANLGSVNFEAYKVAYLGILVEAMGGAVSTNCKSGKDRTGLEELYRNAMLMYFDQYHTLPKFDDVPERRENFVRIFNTLFNSMKTQEAAAMNTPGSFGIKDTAQMLPKDVAASLGASYVSSNYRSKMNKPPTFTSDESAQSKARNAVLSKASSSSSPGRIRRGLSSSSSGIFRFLSRSSPTQSRSSSPSSSPTSSRLSAFSSSSSAPQLSTPESMRELKGLFVTLNSYRYNEKMVDTLLDPEFKKELGKTIFNLLKPQTVSSKEEHDQKIIQIANDVLVYITGKNIDELYRNPEFSRLRNAGEYKRIFTIALEVGHMRSLPLTMDELKSSIDELRKEKTMVDALLDTVIKNEVNKTIGTLLNQQTIMSQADYDQKFIQTANTVLMHVTGKGIEELNQDEFSKLKTEPFFATLFKLAEMIKPQSGPSSSSESVHEKEDDSEGFRPHR